MRPILLLSIAAFTFLRIAAAISDPLPASPLPPNLAVVKVVLTKINATQSVGLCLIAKKNKLSLSTLSGYEPTSFAVQSASLKIVPHVKVKFGTFKGRRNYSSAKQTWTITDTTGEGVKIENDTVRTLIIISRIDKTLTFISKRQTISIPPHSIVLINNPPGDGVLDFGANEWLGYSGRYRQKMSPIPAPTLVVVSPNASGITGGFPAIDEGRIFDTTLDLGIR
jgi:hypothetical protein